MSTTALPKAMRELKSAVYGETLCMLRVLELIAKVDKTREFLRHGHSSLYDYLTVGLKYSEGAAIRRIRAARMLGKDRRIKKLFEQRKVSLCTLSLILNQPELLDEIIGRSKREVEELIALKKGNASQARERIVPILVAVPAKKQHTEIPTATSSTTPSSSNIHCEDLRSQTERQPVVHSLLAKDESNLLASSTTPIQPETILEERYRVTFSYNKETKDSVERARHLLSHKYPDGASIEELFVAGLSALIKDEEKRKNKIVNNISKNSTATSNSITPRNCEKLRSKTERRSNLPAITTSNNSTTNRRYIPAAIKREVYKRDKGTCSYRHLDGETCGSSWQVEVDHITPLALGGKTESANLRLLCRNHNQMVAKDARVYR